MTWLQDSEQKHAYALSTHSVDPPPPHAMQREVPISVEESAPVTSEDHSCSARLECHFEVLGNASALVVIHAQLRFARTRSTASKRNNKEERKKS